jgi:hypothetical protein
VGTFCLGAVCFAVADVQTRAPSEIGRFANRTALWERRGALIQGFRNMYQLHVVTDPDDPDYPLKGWFFGWVTEDGNPGYPGCDAICAARSRSLDSGWEVYAGPAGWDDGRNPATWVPVVTANDRYYDDWHNGDPSVVKVGHRWFMAYSSTGGGLDGKQYGEPGDADGSVQCIMGATSDDGIHWRRTREPLLLYRPEIGQPRAPEGDVFPGGSYARPSLLYDGGKWKLWFDYWEGPRGGCAMGYAENAGAFGAPNAWRVVRGEENPCLSNFPNPDVVKIGGLYYAYADPGGYEPRTLWETRKIVEAVSRNGLDWLALGYVDPEPGVPATHVPEAFVRTEGGRTLIYLTYACQRGGDPYDYRYDRISLMRREVTRQETARLTATLASAPPSAEGELAR